MREPANLPKETRGKNKNDERHNWHWLLMDQAYGIPTHDRFPCLWSMDHAVSDQPDYHENRQGYASNQDCEQPGEKALNVDHVRIAAGLRPASTPPTR
jgi:hypothetical protein